MNKESIEINITLESFEELVSLYTKLSVDIDNAKKEYVARNTNPDWKHLVEVFATDNLETLHETITSILKLYENKSN